MGEEKVVCSVVHQKPARRREEDKPNLNHQCHLSVLKPQKLAMIHSNNLRTT